MRGVLQTSLFAGVVFAVAYFLGASSGRQERALLEWGERLTSSGITAGGVCLPASNQTIRNVSANPPIENSNLISEVPNEVRRSCFQSAKLFYLKREFDPEVISAVWRCEADNLIGEMQLAFFSAPHPLNGSQEFCTVAMFDPDLGIEVGEATKYPEH